MPPLPDPLPTARRSPGPPAAWGGLGSHSSKRPTWKSAGPTTSAAARSATAGSSRMAGRISTGWRAGAILLTTFVAHLFFPRAEHRLWITCAHFGLAALLVILDWRRLKLLVREEAPPPGSSATG